MTERRCQDCRVFYDKQQPCCPKCGAEPYAFNKWLRTAALNRHLYDRASGQ